MNESRRVGLLLILALAMLWVNYWLPAAWDYFWGHNEHAPPNCDFSPCYMAGKAVALGLNPYWDQRDKVDLLEGVAGGPFGSDAYTRGRGLSEYVYPPWGLLLFRPLAALSYTAARFLWTISYLALYALALSALAMGEKPGLRGVSAMTAILLTSLSRLPLLSIRQGKIDVFTASLAMLSFTLCARRRRAWAAILLAIATLLKVNPAFLLLYFVVYRRDWRFLLHYVVWAVVLVLASLWFLPGGLYSEYAIDIFPSILGGRPHYLNQSLIRLFTGIGPRFLPGAVCLLAMTLFGTFCWSRHRPAVSSGEPPTRDIVIFLMNVLVLLLFSAISWGPAYVWTVLPGSLVAVRLWPTLRSWVVWSMGLAVLLLNMAVYPRPVLNSLNIVGGTLLLFLLGLYLVKPGWLTRPSPDCAP